MGPVTWLMVSELFPPHTRPVAMSIATIVNWISAFVVTYTFSAHDGRPQKFRNLLVLRRCLPGGVAVHPLHPLRDQRPLQHPNKGCSCSCTVLWRMPVISRPIVCSP
mmetsp:Transcript_9089/g.17717  ORF Transcript_9089/g.17717 Transcript_9089/m.17717 type:complete len:107 (+) Transcript_9089:857-1177(+)